MCYPGKLVSATLVLSLAVGYAASLYAVEFADPVPYPVGSGPRDIVVADFNGNGRLDFATSNVGSGNISMMGRCNLNRYPPAPHGIRAMSSLPRLAIPLTRRSSQTMTVMECSTWRYGEAFSHLRIPARASRLSLGGVTEHLPARANLLLIRTGWHFSGLRRISTGIS